MQNRFCVIVATLSTAVASLANAEVVVFQDGDFMNWSGAVLADNDASATMTIHPIGGHPGAYLESRTATPGGRGVNHLLINEAIFWAPAIDGAIIDIELGIDHLDGNQGYQLLLLQDGQFYIAPGWGNNTGNHGSWTTLHLGPFEAADFSAVTGVYDADPLVHPDFSVSGAPIQFGFATANFSSGTIFAGYDNWQVSLTVVPEPSAALLLGLGALVVRKRR